MKIERLRDVPPLYRFIKGRLPKTLEARIYENGYGYECTIHVIAEEEFGTGIYAWFRRLGSRGIAHVYSRSIELRRPEYFADFEALCRNYENETGEEVILRYWESAKP